MTNEGTPDRIVGVHLWTVVTCEEATSKAGDAMLRVGLEINLTGNPVKLVDIVMLGGRGWSLGRRKLIGLGLDPSYRGALDPFSFLGRRVWVATAIDARPYLDNKTGQMRPGSRLVVDINQLAHAGYQAEADVPPGAVQPELSDTPF